MFDAVLVWSAAVFDTPEDDLGSAAGIDFVIAETFAPPGPIRAPALRPWRNVADDHLAGYAQPPARRPTPVPAMSSTDTRALHVGARWR